MGRLKKENKKKLKKKYILKIFMIVKHKFHRLLLIKTKNK